MKKKTIIVFAAVLFVALAIAGTVAYFTKEFDSDNNIATAASFDVDVVNADGTTIGDAEFDLDEKLYPGMDAKEVYTFDIRKNNTDVPVEYNVNLSPRGTLFPTEGQSPVELSMQRMIDGDWMDVDHSNTFRPENDVESYRILVDWPHSDRDIDYQGKEGNIKLGVVATQVDAKNDIEGDLVETKKGKETIPGNSEIVGLEFMKDGIVTYMFRFLDGEGLEAQKFILGDLQNPLTKDQMAEQLVKEINIENSADFIKLKQGWDVTQDGATAVFTSKEQRLYEEVGIFVGAKKTGEQVNLQSGSKEVPGTKEVNTLTISGSVNNAGTLVVAFNDGSENLEKTIQISKDDTPVTIAPKIASALNGLTGWDVTNAKGSADVVFTSKEAVADRDVMVTFENN